MAEQTRINPRSVTAETAVGQSAPSAHDGRGRSAVVAVAVAVAVAVMAVMAAVEKRGGRGSEAVLGGHTGAMGVLERNEEFTEEGSGAVKVVCTTFAVS